MTNTIETGSNPHDISPRFCAHVSHNWLTGETGASLVELALTLPLLLFIFLGVAEFARFAWASIEAANAARAGVQYGAQDHTLASDTAGIQAAALNDGINLSGLTATSSHSCACSTAPSTTIVCSTALTTCPSPSIILESVQVNTSATVRPLYHWPGLPTTFTAQGFAIMAVEQ
jgi:Flp pilus assembly protein TadG